MHPYITKYAPILFTSTIFTIALYKRFAPKPAPLPPINVKQGIAENCAVLNDAFTRFVKIIGMEPSMYFYENWLIISRTVFAKEQLIEAAKANASDAKAISCVMQFLGFNVTGDTVQDLVNLDARPEYSFDDEQFSENVFHVIDLDNSGAIDKTELSVAVRDLRLFQGEVQVEELFEEMDIDGSGEISMEEFQGWWERHFDEDTVVADA